MERGDWDPTLAAGIDDGSLFIAVLGADVDLVDFMVDRWIETMASHRSLPQCELTTTSFSVVLVV